MSLGSVFVVAPDARTLHALRPALAGIAPDARL